jgi:predicted DNA-binding transcriptional regulator AlpA
MYKLSDSCAKGVQMSDETKAVVTVSEMARMCGLSRARFYQLQKAGVFPAPTYQAGRPVYTEEQQAVCLEVRRKNRGINGEPVLFYARRRPIAPAKKAPKTSAPAPKNGIVAALVDGLNALGLTTATAAQVVEVTKELFPEGTDKLDQAEVLRAVFLHLKRQNSAGNEGR